MKNIKLALIALTLCFTAISESYGQNQNLDNFKEKYINWFNKDPETDETMGTSVDKVYQEFIKNSSDSINPIIVAVIDNGIDITHEDLLGKIWINTDEIPDNGIDDDQNGYIDDIHGWNFLGNSAGENIEQENLEFTRIIRQGDSLSDDFQRAQKEYDKRLKKMKGESEMISEFAKVYRWQRTIIFNETGVLVKTKDDLSKIRSSNPEVLKAKSFLDQNFKVGLSPEKLEDYEKYINENLAYFLNKSFQPRKIIGDDPHDISDKIYGNNIVAGPNPDHGTFVAGIIAANRTNQIGIQGIASKVKIMAI
ncbi:MAG: S8 family serine peptidase, partial [Nitrososphaeraceae archaeon]|nr:S8 family serine peptidase [Nitrososphaeraceae archaeon]